MQQRAADDAARAIILAAGLGKRLRDGSNDAGHAPKALLSFAGRSLIARHVALLRASGVDDITAVLGYRAEAVSAELDALPGGAVARILNPDYREGSIVSLQAAADVLRSGRPVILMDADVLCDRRMMARLVSSRLANVLLLDRDLEPGDEPVKICLAGERIVDFRKRPEHAGDRHGESVGFFRFAPDAAQELARRVDRCIAEGQRGLDHEEPIREMMLASPDGRFGVEDVTGLPWTEIDFSADIDKANALLSLLAE